MTTSTMQAPISLSVSALDQALETILQHNFDEDSKVCLVTLMKMLDNCLHNPHDPRVRSIKLSNAAFTSKVASRRGGVDFLLACGFAPETAELPLLAKPNERPEKLLVLRDEENREACASHLVTARRLLLTRATQDLNMKADELPAYQPLPPRNNSGATFNPYQPLRYDGMSAATGAQMTAGQNYESTTEKQLQALQSKQQKLEQQMQQPLMDRAWVATMPNQKNTKAPSINMATTSEPEDTWGTGSLIAAQFQKQQEQRRQREEGGFTTKSMRELEKIKKQKVYSHTQLALQFSDGTILQGKFLPKETVRIVLQELATCFLEPPPSTEQMELYITPPRKTLKPSATLQEEGLVPAAKVFVKIPKLPSYRPFLKPELFAENIPTAFPSAQPIVADNDSTKDLASSDEAAAKKPKATAEDKEAALLQRMLGGGRTLGGSSSGANNKGESKLLKGNNKPKWFK